MQKDDFIWKKYLLVHMVLISQAANGSWLERDPGALLASYVVGNLSDPNVRLHYKEYLPIIKSIERGSQIAKKECKHQFKWERWNCPDQALTRESMTTGGNRETAFVQALNAAGFMFDLTLKCRTGEIPGCKCTRQQHIFGPGGDHPWEWGGCNDNMQFEEEVSKFLANSFVLRKNVTNSLVLRNDAKAAMYIHNAGASRQGMKRVSKTHCRCIGESATCVFKTCWEYVQSFRQVGSLLKRRYRRAFQASYNAGQLKIKSGERKGKEIRMDQLVYLEPSPDYCQPDKISGLYGTENRHCFPESSDGGNGTVNTQGKEGSCKRLCEDCGLSIRNETVAVKSKCCEFSFCCHVGCKDCVQRRVQFFCSKV